MELTEREKKLLIFFIGFLILVGFFWQALPYFKHKIDIEKRTIVDLQLLKREVERKEEFETIYKLYDDHLHSFEKFNSIAREKPEMLPYATLIERAAKGKVQIANIAFGKVEKAKEGEFGKMPIIVAGKGDYFVIKEFLIELEKTLPLMSIQSISISPLGGAENIYSININLFTYTLSWPQEIPEKKEIEKEVKAE